MKKPREQNRKNEKTVHVYVTVSPVGKIGVMFLDEVVLGEEYFMGLNKANLVRCPSSLTKSPGGYDSVVALRQSTIPGYIKTQ